MSITLQAFSFALTAISSSGLWQFGKNESFAINVSASETTLAMSSTSILALFLTLWPRLSSTSTFVTTPFSFLLTTFT